MSNDYAIIYESPYFEVRLKAMSDTISIEDYLLDLTNGLQVLKKLDLGDLLKLLDSTESSSVGEDILEENIDSEQQDDNKLNNINHKELQYSKVVPELDHKTGKIALSYLARANGQSYTQTTEIHSHLRNEGIIIDADFEKRLNRILAPFLFVTGIDSDSREIRLNSRGITMRRNLERELGHGSMYVSNETNPQKESYEILPALRGRYRELALKYLSAANDKSFTPTKDIYDGFRRDGINVTDYLRSKLTRNLNPFFYITGMRVKKEVKLKPEGILLQKQLMDEIYGN